MKDPQRNDQDGNGLSRRQFLRGSGVSAAATAFAATPLGLLAEDVKKEEKGSKSDVVGMGPAPVKVTLQVNGRELTTSIEPRTTLLDSLRNHLDVTGCKRVCDRGTCGACTVMIDGRPIYSCTMFAVEAQGKRIRTAEALFDKGTLDAVPAAFVQFDAQQCGFCTPGFVVAMRAAFDRNPKATPAEIEEALAGNICRCGTYQQMRDTIASLCKKGG
jgi:xanthine dehydrogenase YagT iron-sulfur-binding subunit